MPLHADVSRYVSSFHTHTDTYKNTHTKEGPFDFPASSQLCLRTPHQLWLRLVFHMDGKAVTIRKARQLAGDSFFAG